MPRKLEILDRDDWFLREGLRGDGNFGYPIYYRHAISYSIAMNIIAGKDKAWMSQEVDNLIKSLNNNYYYQSKNFIELYPFAGNPFAGTYLAEGTNKIPKGFVLLDQTDSYYPLMFYGESDDRDGKPRVLALELSLLSIKKGLPEIFEKFYGLRDKSEWDFDFQNDLLELYPDKPNT